MFIWTELYNRTDDKMEFEDQPSWLEQETPVLPLEQLILLYNEKRYDELNEYVYLRCNDRTVKVSSGILRSDLLKIMVKYETDPVTFEEGKCIIHLPEDYKVLLDYNNPDIDIVEYLYRVYVLLGIDDQGFLQPAVQRFREQSQSYWNELRTKYFPFLWKRFSTRTSTDGDTNMIGIEVKDDIKRFLTDPAHPFKRIYKGSRNHGDPREDADRDADEEDDVELYNKICDYIKSTTIEERNIPFRDRTNASDFLVGVSNDTITNPMDPIWKRARQVIAVTRQRYGDPVETVRKLYPDSDIGRDLREHRLGDSPGARQAEFFLKRTIRNAMLNDYTTKPGIFYPQPLEFMAYDVVDPRSKFNVPEESTDVYTIRYFYDLLKSDPHLVKSREFCDLCLKDSSYVIKDHNYIRYGLFFLYLEESIVKSGAKRDSRFVFTYEEFIRLLYTNAEQFENLVQKIWETFYPLPFIPDRQHFFGYRDLDHNRGFRWKSNLQNLTFEELMDKVFPEKNTIPWRLESNGKTIRANLNGSLLLAIIFDKRIPTDKRIDMDIRLDYEDSDETVSDEDIDKYLEVFIGWIQKYQTLENRMSENSQIEYLSDIKIEDIDLTKASRVLMNEDERCLASQQLNDRILQEISNIDAHYQQVTNKNREIATYISTHNDLFAKRLRILKKRIDKLRETYMSYRAKFSELLEIDSESPEELQLRVGTFVKIQLLSLADTMDAYQLTEYPIQRDDDNNIPAGFYHSFDRLLGFIGYEPIFVNPDILPDDPPVTGLNSSGYTTLVNPVPEEDLPMYKKKQEEYLEKKTRTDIIRNWISCFNIPVKTTVEKIQTGKLYKYVIKTSMDTRYDIFRAPFGFISNYHVPPVRYNYDGTTLHMFPSCMVAWSTGLCIDLRYFKAEGKAYPIDTIIKYADRGFSFLLSSTELEQTYERLMDLRFHNDWPDAVTTPFDLAMMFLRDPEFGAHLVSPILLEAISELSLEQFEGIIALIKEDVTDLEDIPEKLRRAMIMIYIYTNCLEDKLKRLPKTTNNFTDI